VYLYSDKFSAHLGALKSSGFESDIRNNKAATSQQLRNNNNQQLQPKASQQQPQQSNPQTCLQYNKRDPKTSKIV